MRRARQTRHCGDDIDALLEGPRRSRQLPRFAPRRRRDLRRFARSRPRLAAHRDAVIRDDTPAATLAFGLPDVPTSAPAPRPITEGPGSLIGPYKLLQKIGEGGMGAVFMAEQEKPVRRRVALKIIKPGMDTDQVIARFEAERQALAMMDHPNIAKVLDAGATDTGRPFFVMELVKGIPITEYCDRTISRRASGWSCSSPSARRSSTPTRRGSSTATSSRRTSW